MNIKRTKINGKVFRYENDAVKGTYKYWEETLKEDVYVNGMTLSEVRAKYNYGSYKPYWLSTNYWKKRFDAGYSLWEQKRIADKNANTYSGNATGDETGGFNTANKQTTYIIIAVVAITVLLLIAMFFKKGKVSNATQTGTN